MALFHQSVRLLAVTLVILCHLHLSSACTCFPAHPQQFFCGTDFSIKVKPKCARAFDVLDPSGPIPDPYKDDNNYQIEYKVEILEVFKGDGLKSGQTILLYTAGTSAACGLKIMNSPSDHSPWLISGYRNNGRMHFNICGLNKEWNTVTDAQVAGLRGEYAGKNGENCKECSIIYCFQNCPAKSAKTCQYSSADLQCYNNNARCEVSYGFCVWKGNSSC